jgi:hypothetical protein
MGMNKTEAATVATVIGRNMRRIHEEHGKVLRDVAEAARGFGYRWHSKTVSRLERGEQDFTFEEIASLPSIMTFAVDDVVTMHDLLAENPDDADEFSAVATVRLLFAEPFSTANKTPGYSVRRRKVRGMLEMEKREVQANRQPAEDDDDFEYSLRVGDELAVPAGAVMAAIYRLVGTGAWHSRFPYRERERRLVVSSADLSDRLRMRTMRGHISRQLVREISDVITTMKDKGYGEAEEGAERVVGEVADVGQC